MTADLRPHDAPRRARNPWWPLWVVAVVGVYPISRFGPRYLGSGDTCYGIGWGCDIEPLFDTAAVLLVYVVVLVVGFVASSRIRRRRRVPWLPPTVVGIAAAAAAVAWTAQLPNYDTRPEPVSVAVNELSAVLAAAPSDGDLAHAVDALRRTPPEPCIDKMERRTGGWRVSWRGETETADRDTSDLRAFADALERRGYALDTDGFGIEDNRVLATNADGYRVSVIARAYVPLFELWLLSPCMQPAQ